MTADEMAEALAYELGRDGAWRAEYDFPECVLLTIESGERFTITVAKDGEDD